MGNRDDSAGILGEVLFEPQDALGIEVVGGFVKQQEIGLFKQKFAERNTPLFTTRQDTDFGIRRWAPKCIHCLFELRIEIPRVGVVDGFL